MPNPLIAQGNLNRIRATIVVPDFPTLNVPASYLTRQGISLAFEGENVQTLPTMTGVVQSPEPYVMTTATVHLVKSAGLAAAYEAQRVLNALIGDITVRPDTTGVNGLLPFLISNVAIQQLRELDFSGGSPDYVVTLRGTYYINNSMWD